MKWSYLANEIIFLFATISTEFEIVLIEFHTVVVIAWLGGPQVRAEFVPGIEPAEGALVFQIRGANPEGLVGVPCHQVLLQLCDHLGADQLYQVP